MTTSRQKATGSAAERMVAKLLNGTRVGQLGGPVDVRTAGMAVQVKCQARRPSENAMLAMLERMGGEPGMPAVVYIDRPGRGHRSEARITVRVRDFEDWYEGLTLQPCASTARTLTFDLYDWAAWFA